MESGGFTPAVPAPVEQDTVGTSAGAEKNEMFCQRTMMITDNLDVTRRRSSNRSIKRRKFDDELVEYSLGLPGVSNIKSNRTRTHSQHTEYITAVTSQQPQPSAATAAVAAAAVPAAVATAAVAATVVAPVAQPPVEVKRKPVAKTISSNSRRTKKGRQHNQIATKDLGRWKPTDDLALIIGVQQTNDLKTVHLGTKFSCRFTVQELQQRWYALLYDQAVSRVAVAAMRNLHPDMVAAVQDRALWSTQEEELLGTIKSNSHPTVNDFAELLAQHPEVFYSGRTASALYRHWQTLRMYHLLPDQLSSPLPASSRQSLSFNEAEDIIQDAELSEPPDEAIDREIRLQQRKNAREIRQLENEVGRWNVLVDSVTGVCPGELDGQTLAVLRGRMVRYLMRSREITIGRTAKGNVVDVDLSLEGPAHKISRRQGTLRLRNTGEFYLCSEGKRPIFVDGRPITAGNKVRLYDNAVIEISCLRLIFSINHDLIRVIHNESIRFNVTP